MTSHSNRQNGTRALAAFARFVALSLACFFAFLSVAPAAQAQAIPRQVAAEAGKPKGLDDGTSKLPALDLGTNTSKPAPVERPPAESASDAQVLPFGANLFMGNFLRTRESGINPSYTILPGDKVAVYTWGAIEVSGVFVVDTQGNIFLPQVGPIHLGGVPNGELTKRVRAGLERVYARYFDVYTNLLTTNPVAVFVTGGVPRPGKYAGIPSDSVLFFLDQAGGIDPTLGSYRHISVLRGEETIAEYDLYDFVLEGELPQIQFENNDTILVHKRGPVVELKGDVARSSLLEFRSESVTGAQALRVVPGAARVTQVTVSGIREGVPISRTLDIERFRDFVLHDGDSIDARDDGRSDMVLVNVEGEFDAPSVMAIRRGSRLVDVLNHIPVDPTFADTSAVHLRRKSVAQAQKDSIDDATFRLERSALLALSQSSGESNIRAKEAELALKFVERARLIQPLGRVVTARDGHQRNLLLQEGDVIVIPARTNVVRVGGEVMMAQAVMFQPGLTAGDYITDAGGYTDRSDESRVIVIRANAEVDVGGPELAVLPGDEVLVPPRVDTKTLQNVADVTQIIYQIAVSAAVVLAIM